MKQVVFDKKTGAIALKRIGNPDEQKQFHGNFVYDILDPVTLQKIETVGSAEHEWKELPPNDSRVQFCKMFDVIDSADIDYDISSRDEDATVEGACINNRHEIFVRVRKIFMREKSRNFWVRYTFCGLCGNFGRSQPN